VRIHKLLERRAVGFAAAIAIAVDFATVQPLEPMKERNGASCTSGFWSKAVLSPYLLVPRVLTLV
jgi:hypothetical protein